MPFSMKIHDRMHAYMHGLGGDPYGDAHPHYIGCTKLQ